MYYENFEDKNVGYAAYAAGVYGGTVKGYAEAEAVRAKALAEAEGLDKKAEAMQKMQEAAILQMYFEKLPEIAKAVAEPLANIDTITMYGEGNTSKLVSDITASTNQISNGLLDGMGISLKDLMNSLLAGRAIGAGIGAAIPPAQMSDKPDTVDGPAEVKKEPAKEPVTTANPAE